MLLFFVRGGGGENQLWDVLSVFISPWLLVGTLATCVHIYCVYKTLLCVCVCWYMCVCVVWRRGASLCVDVFMRPNGPGRSSSWNKEAVAEHRLVWLMSCPRVHNHCEVLYLMYVCMCTYVVCVCVGVYTHCILAFEFSGVTVLHFEKYQSLYCVCLYVGWRLNFLCMLANRTLLFQR